MPSVTIWVWSYAGKQACKLSSDLCVWAMALGHVNTHIHTNKCNKCDKIAFPSVKILLVMPFEHGF